MSLWSDAWRQDPAGAREDAGRPWKVSELTREIRTRLDGLGAVAVEGEVVGLKKAASGHVYFALKDLDARIDCAVWKSAVEKAVRFDLKEGMQVVARGKLDVYAPRGTYSLIVSRLEQAGLGTLLAKLEELRARLRAEGWFERHRPLPPLPRTVGVVTSRDGAALQDFLRTRSQRWPLYPLRLAHTPVQGAGASAEIAAAIRRLDASGVDVICVVRGGGSLEDLWAFNELPVLEAVRAASVPVVSGVGHETDTTLCDLVADVRAHTPTDAAQRAIPDRRALVEAVERGAEHLARALEGHLEQRAQRLHRAERLFPLAQARLDRAASRLGGAAARLFGQAPHARLERLAARLERSGPRLARAAARALEQRERRIDVGARALQAISPFAVLQRGYSITRRLGGAPVTDAAALAPGEAVETLFARGAAVSRVEAVRPAREGQG